MDSSNDLNLDIWKSDVKKHTENHNKLPFLTGATGFIGSFLLHRLLETKKDNVICLIRGDKEEAARARLRENMSALKIWNEGYYDRIHIILGDLSQEKLGLDEESYQWLSDTISLIYHAGAFVNFVYSFDTLKKPNVAGTQEIINLAKTNKGVPIFYISSMNIFTKEDLIKDPIVTESRIPMEEEENESTKFTESLVSVGGGYLKTKREAERLLNQARMEGIPVNIYRVGHVTGDSEYGACQTNDFFWRMVKASLHVLKWPGIDAHVNFTPVDYIAEGVAYLSDNIEGYGKNYHIYNEMLIDYNQFAQLIKDNGYDLTICTYAEWAQAMGFRGKISADESEDEVYEHVKYEQTNTKNDLKNSGIECCNIDSKLIRTYFEYFKEIGFIK